MQRHIPGKYRATVSKHWDEPKGCILFSFQPRKGSGYVLASWASWRGKKRLCALLPIKQDASCLWVEREPEADTRLSNAPKTSCICKQFIIGIKLVFALEYYRVALQFSILSYIFRTPFILEGFAHSAILIPGELWFEAVCTTCEFAGVKKRSIFSSLFIIASNWKSCFLVAWLWRVEHLQPCVCEDIVEDLKDSRVILECMRNMRNKRS